MLNPERDALWARLEGVSFLTDDEKRAAAGYAALGEGALAKHRPFDVGAKYRPDQPRVPAGQSGGGQWTSGGDVQLAQNRGRGSYTVGGYNFEATPAQIMRLSSATNAADVAVARVREIDPNWRPRPGIYESAEGAIADQLAIEAEAKARFDQLRRDAIPNTSHNWGVTRLRKVLNDRGFVLEGPTRAPGFLYRNANTGEEVRIMERPARRYRSETDQKHFNDHYYRYKSGPGKPWGQHTTIPDKEER